MENSNFTYKTQEEFLKEQEALLLAQETAEITEPEIQSKILQTAEMPVLPEDVPFTLENPLFVPGFLSGQIGKYVVAEFLEGQTLVAREGTLKTVGVSFILLEAKNGNSIVCDLYSLRFATIMN